MFKLQKFHDYFMRGRLLRQARTADAPFFYGSPYFPEGRKEVL